ncbi:DNA repair protein XRCC3-like isoform X2 [Anneissia japonica]|uniref:DNA repair protein XRCC3-like isoform X2 n=1 Tax=Anneissia japonica TaxID=1529436 RepID=UPI001425A9B7|nr:DNA repair protein XRCC3-like isoform X2 [Anneissia japonica]
MENLDLPPKIVTSAKRGLKTLASVLCLSKPDLERATNLNSHEVSILVQAVSEAAYQTPIITVLDIKHGKCHTSMIVQKLSLGCPRLDAFLHGGILSQGITEIAGESASGKTQICIQLCLTVQCPKALGGLDGGAVYICTEDAFPSKRLHQMIQMFNEKIGSEMASKLKLGDHIYVEHISEMDQLWHCITQRIPILLTRGLVKLVVIDSLAAIFRCEYDSHEIAQRAKHIQSVGAKLNWLSSQYDVPVVCVNQVTANMKRSSNPFEPSVVPALGLTWATFVKVRLMISRTNYRLNVDSQGSEECRPGLNPTESVVRSMEVVFSPHLPKDKCYFIVEQSGVIGLA